MNRGLAESREKAGALVMAGDILVNGQVEYKAGAPVTPETDIQKKEKYPFVSRGASKIQQAFQTFGIGVKGLRVLDVGISTGGFSDYMLQHGALHVTGVDVNIRQVDQRLRQDPRVTLVQLNARHLKKEHLEYPPELITIDVSFISVTKILPALTVFPGAPVLTLIKPQFEVHKQKVEKGGVIRRKETHLELLLQLKEKCEAMKYGVTGLTLAGIKGRKGNQEYFFLLEYGKVSSINDKIVADAISI